MFNAKAAVKAARKYVRTAQAAVLAAVAPYKVQVYTVPGYHAFGTHYALTRTGALVWLNLYPRGSHAVIFGRGVQVLPCGVALPVNGCCVCLPTVTRAAWRIVASRAA